MIGQQPQASIQRPASRAASWASLTHEAIINTTSMSGMSGRGTYLSTYLPTHRCGSEHKAMFLFRVDVYLRAEWDAPIGPPYGMLLHAIRVRTFRKALKTAALWEFRGYVCEVAVADLW